MPKPRIPSPLSVGFVSLGCAKNLVDSQIMAGALLDAGIPLAASPEEAGIVIVNTCAFIESAREESIDGILRACRLKSTGKARAVIVAGCLSQRYRQDLAASLPEVDAFIGLDEIDRIAGIVEKLARGERHVYAVSGKAVRLFESREHRIVFSGGPFAYLKIAEGCNHLCAFCAIPGIRGRHRSRPVGRIVEEAEQLLAGGYRELNLISQDITSYGRDLKDGSSLPGLLRRLAECRGNFWIRLLYGYPVGVGADLLEAMRELPCVCPYLDVPIQHSHPEILRAMKRGHTARAVRDMAGVLRERIPGITLRTTCLVGFPGETDRHFEHLLDHVRTVRFDHLGVFVYSPEEDTVAAKLPGRPSLQVAEARRAALLEAQRDIVDENARRLIGTESTALLERPLPDVPGSWIARTPRQAPEVDGDTFVDRVSPKAAPGDFVRIRYTAQSDYDLRARCLPGR